MRDFVLYLLVDPDVKNGKRCRYVGITTRGVSRYAEHLVTTSGTRCAEWINEMQNRPLPRVPHLVIILQSESLKELQIEEIKMIKALRLIGDSVMNITPGGDPGTSRNPLRVSSLDFFTQPELVAVQRRIDDHFRSPARKELSAFKELDEVFDSLGVFSEKYERARAKSIVALLSSSLKEDVVPNMKEKCQVGFCTRQVHAKGLCQGHYDHKRRKDRKVRLQQLRSQVSKSEANSEHSNNSIR